MFDTDTKVVAVALLTREDVAKLGSILKKVFTIEDTPHFEELTKALDAVERGEWGFSNPS